jgi:2-desacetyl-2-hydroxyethyl bacteriochlorophyllide A dehydrogenase
VRERVLRSHQLGTYKREESTSLNTNQVPTTMRAAVLRAPREMSVENVPVPQPAPDEVLVKVDANGLCGSDVHCYTGERVLEYPMVLGHEIAGHIVAVGENVSPERIGERVSVEPNFGCGECPLCKRGLERICLRKQTIGITRWGGLAEYVTVPHDYAWPIPESFELRDAATIEPTTVGVHAFSRAQVTPGQTVAVIGCGGVGLLIVTIAVAQGTRVVVIEPNPARRAAALAAGAVQYAEPRNADEARAFFEEEGVVAIFECAGIRATTQLALDAAPPGTRIVLVGLSTEDVTFNPLRFVRQELEIRGTLIYEHPTDYPVTIELIATGKLKPGATASEPQPLEKAASLLEAMAEGKLNAKPIISPSTTLLVSVVE